MEKEKLIETIKTCRVLLSDNVYTLMRKALEMLRALEENREEVKHE